MKPRWQLLSGTGFCSWGLMSGYEGSQACVCDSEDSVHLTLSVPLFLSQNTVAYPLDWLMTHTLKPSTPGMWPVLLETLPGISDPCPWSRRGLCLIALKTLGLCHWKWQSETWLWRAGRFEWRKCLGKRKKQINFLVKCFLPHSTDGTDSCTMECAFPVALSALLLLFYFNWWLQVLFCAQQLHMVTKDHF